MVQKTHLYHTMNGIMYILVTKYILAIQNDGRVSIYDDSRTWNGHWDWDELEIVFTSGQQKEDFAVEEREEFNTVVLDHLMPA